MEEDEEDGFVLVGFEEEGSQKLVEEESQKVHHDPALRKCRSRGRTDSETRRLRQQQVDLERTGSTVLLVSNLRDGCHAPFHAMLRKDFGISDLKEIHITPEHNFGFITLSTMELMNRAITLYNETSVNGSILSVTRCAVATPGRNPRAGETPSMPCDTLAIKNLPFQITMSSLLTDLTALACPPPLEAYFHVSPQGNFSGTTILRYSSVQIAQEAFEILNLATVLGRQIRAEYKRTDRRVQPRMYVPVSMETEAIYKRLQQFKASSEQSVVVMTSTMPAGVRDQFSQMIAWLGLRAISDGETPEAQLRVLRSLDDTPSPVPKSAASPAPSLVSFASSRMASFTRSPLGPDGTRGFQRGSPLSLGSADSGVYRSGLGGGNPPRSGGSLSMPVKGNKTGPTWLFSTR